MEYQINNKCKWQYICMYSVKPRAQRGFWLIFGALPKTETLTQIYIVLILSILLI